MSRKVSVIGAGFSGLVSAGLLADGGFEVDLYEKNPFIGGRASSMSLKGFHFDKGPSWYWMPDVFDRVFQRMGSARSDHYKLTRLDPAFRVYFGAGDYIDIPDQYEDLQQLFEELESGAAFSLDRFMEEARQKYDLGMNGMARLPSVSWKEFLSLDLWRTGMKMDLFSSVSDHVRKRFKNDRIRKIMEFPVLFLGASATRIPALYTLMNYAGLCLGTFYPEGGFAGVVEGFARVAEQKGVRLHTSSPVAGFDVKNYLVKNIVLEDERHIETELVVGTGDYAHIDGLLGPGNQNYDRSYWENKTFAPSAVLFFIGLNKKLKNIEHHNLFFHAPFDRHIDQIYKEPGWPEDPLFYVCCPSRTDPLVAPEGYENMFFLMPVATGLPDSAGIRSRYFELLISRFEEVTGEEIRGHIVINESYGPDDFTREYHAYGGNAYGLANTLRQTALFKPSICHRKISNLFYAGQLTVPGPGVPPSLISGEIVADYISEKFNSKI